LGTLINQDLPADYLNWDICQPVFSATFQLGLTGKRHHPANILYRDIL
jgi:hypothetical protein